MRALWATFCWNNFVEISNFWRDLNLCSHWLRIFRFCIFLIRVLNVLLLWGCSLLLFFTVWVITRHFLAFLNHFIIKWCLIPHYFFFIGFLDDDLFSNLLGLFYLAFLNFSFFTGLLCLLNKAKCCGFLLRDPDLDLFIWARVTQSPIRLRDYFHFTINAAFWGRQRLVLFVRDFPRKLFEASLAKEVKRCSFDFFGYFAVRRGLELECEFVLVLLATLFFVWVWHSLFYFFLDNNFNNKF